MPPPADYHMHTPLCRHAVGEPRAYAAQAIAAGLSEIGFSDHSPMPRDDFDDWRMRLDQLDEYVEKVHAVRQDFPALRVKLALEVDFLPDGEAWVRELAARHPWDYFIGSVHYVMGSWDLDNPNKVAEWNRHDPWEVWSLYFERLTAAAESGLFQIIGHADLCKKFCFLPTRDCTPLFHRFLEAARDHGAAIELNTAGLRKQCREIYPSRRFLELARAHEIPITFGSDAHAPGEVGLNFAEAVELAQSVGFTHCCQFNQRDRRAVAI